MTEGRGLLRIGELGNRLGVSPELLRAWERRYGLLQPSRSSGGFRLYSEADEARVKKMQENLAAGLAAAEAARLALASVDSEPTQADVAMQSSASLVDELRAALDSYDEVAAHEVLDRTFAALSLDPALSEVVLPYLVDLGERWASGEISVAQEHFASNLLRGRLLNLARGWDQGYGPRALLACPERELHDLALIMFGLALNKRGWRITFLGANTPADAIISSTTSLLPDAVVIAGSDPEFMRPLLPRMRTLAQTTRVLLGGRGATEEAAVVAGASLLEPDPIAGAEVLAKSLPWPG